MPRVRLPEHLLARLADEKLGRTVSLSRDVVILIHVGPINIPDADAEPPTRMQRRANIC